MGASLTSSCRDNWGKTGEMAGGKPARIEAAILVSSRWKSRPDQRQFGELLGRSDIELTVVASLEEAHAIVAVSRKRAQCVILDADEVVGGSAVDVVTLCLQRLKKEAPWIAPIVVATLPSTKLVIAAFRAGAADVIDLASSDEQTVLDALAAASTDHRRRVDRASRVDELKLLIDDFLRVLVKAERRTLELEAALADPKDKDAAEHDETLAPQILVVDDESQVINHVSDALAEVGLDVIPAYSGEEAIGLFERVASTGRPIDLVLVDKNLPGISGLETIRELRGRNAALPCVLMTGYSSNDAAMRAADMGVVGYVLKPFDDVKDLARRVKDYAERFAAERRERRYMAQIKRKHAQFLERYRQIAADLDRLKD